MHAFETPEFLNRGRQSGRRSRRVDLAVGKQALEPVTASECEIKRMKEPTQIIYRTATEERYPAA
jgi:hypothetical protein